MTDDLTFALVTIRKAGEIALKYYEKGVPATMKDDNTPVTIADKECEHQIRQAITKTFPNDAILGEEEGASDAGTSKRKWIIDPIDGTYNYARQVPIWALLLALEVDGEIVLGIVHAPAMGETFWASKGGGCYRNGDRIHVSKIAEVSESQFVFGSPARIAHDGYWDGFRRVIESTYRQRGFGDYLNFAHVFIGKAEAAMETGLKPWDLAPMKVLVEEAGGRFSDLSGGTSIYKGECLVSNGLVHDEILKLLTA